MAYNRCPLVALACSFLSSVCFTAEINSTGKLTIPTLKTATDISGIAFAEEGALLFLAADEGGELHILKRKSNENEYELDKSINILGDDREDGVEADLEGLAVDGKWLYAIGSHSAKRKKVDVEKRTKAENRERLQELDHQKSRRQLARIRLSTIHDEHPEIDHSHLWKRIKNDELLEPFTQIPSKENGVDIEGVTVDAKRILVGFRSPVLRGGYSVIMDTRFDEDSSSGLLFIHLKGDGIRDLAKLDAGRFLILSGPSGEGKGAYRVHLWNGQDGTPGKDGAATGVSLELGSIPAPEGSPDAKAEGIAIQRVEGRNVDIVVVYDGTGNGAPFVFRLDLP